MILLKYIIELAPGNLLLGVDILKFNLFSSGFFRFFSRVADLMLLNALFLVCCLPIVTIGASISALYSVSLKLVRQKDSYITKDFFRAFRQNLKQGIVIHLILTVASVIIVTDLLVIWSIMEASAVFKGLFFVMAILALLFFMASVYIYPMLAQFKNTLKGYFRNAAILSFKHLRYTIMFLLLTILPFAAALLLPGALEWEILIFLLLGFSGMVYINSIFFSAIFKVYMEEDPEDPCE